MANKHLKCFDWKKHKINLQYPINYGLRPTGLLSDDQISTSVVCASRQQHAENSLLTQGVKWGWTCAFGTIYSYYSPHIQYFTHLGTTVHLTTHIGLFPLLLQLHFLTHFLISQTKLYNSSQTGNSGAAWFYNSISSRVPTSLWCLINTDILFTSLSVSKI